MKQKGFCILATLLVMSMAAPAAFSGYKIVDGPKDFYYGHISYLDTQKQGQDPVVFREGQKHPEQAVLNLPLGPGDVIQTFDRRCEIQFDNGTLVRLDFSTELKIETIMAQSLSTLKKMSNLLLARGRVYVMYKKYNSDEIFQFITPRAAVKMDHHAVAMIRVTSDGQTELQVERGKAGILCGPDQEHTSEKKVKEKEKAIVTAGHELKAAAYETASDFGLWNDAVNDNFRALHEESYLPKPIQKLPPAVFYFAQKYGNAYGEWLWHDLYGYVWRPFYNDSFPWGSWQPYVYGTWSSYSGQLFWIPGEPWGWVPYHLGIWTWDKNKGWLWLPGSLFAPAWAVWEFYFGHYFWRPWSLLDWSDEWAFGFGGGMYGYEPLPGGFYASRPSPAIAVHSIRRDQLRKKTPSLPLPKEMKKSFRATVTALKNGDQQVIASFQEMLRQRAAIKKEDLAFPRLQEKVLKPGEISRLPELSSPSRRMTVQTSEEVSREALRMIQRSQAVAEVRTRIVPSAGGPSDPQPSFREFNPGVSSRFRDWNPDIKTAMRLGLDISYSSRTNEVSCPQLGFSSRDVNLRTRLSGDGVVNFGSSGANSPGVASSSPSGQHPSSSRQSDSSGGKGGGDTGKKN